MWQNRILALRAHYEFSQGLSDTSGQELHCETQGQEFTNDRFSQSNEAVEINDGEYAYIMLNHTVFDNLNDLSFGIWVKFLMFPYPTKFQAVIDGTNLDGVNQIRLECRQDRCRLTLKNEVNYQVPYLFVANRHYHIVVTRAWASNFYQLYINGRSVGAGYTGVNPISLINCSEYGLLIGQK